MKKEESGRFFILHSKFEILNSISHHSPSHIRTRDRPRPFQQNEAVLSRRDGRDAEKESTEQIQDLIRSRFGDEAAELLRPVRNEDEDRSNERHDLKQHDETNLRCAFRFSVRRVVRPRTGRSDA
jgi:hypothetical protein